MISKNEQNRFTEFKNVFKSFQTNAKRILFATRFDAPFTSEELAEVIDKDAIFNSLMKDSLSKLSLMGLEYTKAEHEKVKAAVEQQINDLMVARRELGPQKLKNAGFGKNLFAQYTNVATTDIYSQIEQILAPIYSEGAQALTMDSVIENLYNYMKENEDFQKYLSYLGTLTSNGSIISRVRDYLVPHNPQTGSNATMNAAFAQTSVQGIIKLRDLLNEISEKRKTPLTSVSIDKLVELEKMIDQVAQKANSQNAYNLEDRLNSIFEIGKVNPIGGLKLFITLIEAQDWKTSKEKRYPITVEGEIKQIPASIFKLYKLAKVAVKEVDANLNEVNKAKRLAQVAENKYKADKKDSSLDRATKMCQRTNDKSAKAADIAAKALKNISQEANKMHTRTSLWSFFRKPEPFKGKKEVMAASAIAEIKKW